MLQGDPPALARLSFPVRTDARGRAKSMVQPRRPQDPSERYWPSDGVVVDGVAHAFAMRIQDAPTPPFAFPTTGAPGPDGCLYLSGYRSGCCAKSLLAARVLLQQIRQFDACWFWDGRFLLVYMTEPLGRTVAVRYGASPLGPWGKAIPVWDCPEALMTPNTFVYGAKVHPHLSAQGEVLISCQVNCFDFWENFSAGGAAIYRPRFLRLPLP